MASKGNKNRGRKAWKKANIDAVKDVIADNIIEKELESVPDKFLFVEDTSAAIKNAKLSPVSLKPKTVKFDPFANSKQKKLYKNAVSRIEKASLKKEESNEAHVYDIWSEPSSVKKTLDPYPVNVDRFETKAVIIPHEGLSYQPDGDSQMELVAIAEFEKNQKKLQQEIIRDKLTPKEVKFTPIQGDSADEFALTEEETKKLRKVAHELALTSKMRQKVVKLKRDRNIANQKAINKKKLRDISNIKSIVEEVSQQNREKEIKSTEKETYIVRPGKEKYLGQETVYHTPEQVPASLRQIQRQGSLVTDAFDSVLRRNLVEYTTKKAAPKKRVKSYDTNAVKKAKLHLKRRFNLK